jgi:hypothetical protein
MVNASIAYGIPKEHLKTEMFVVPKMIGIGVPTLRMEILKKLYTVDFNYAAKRSKWEKSKG